MPALDDGTPLFVQIAEQLADDIVDGGLADRYLAVHTMPWPCSAVDTALGVPAGG